MGGKVKRVLSSQCLVLRKGGSSVARAVLLLSVLLSTQHLALSPALAEGPSRRERLRWASEAQALMAQQKYEAAAAWLEKAVAPGASKKDLADWWPVLGRCHEAVKNYQKALVSYQRALELKPKSVDRMLDLARLYAAVDLNDQAIDLYQKVLDKDRHRKDVVLAMAEAHFRQRRFEAAEELAERYLKSEPQDPYAQRLAADIEEALGDVASAAHR